MNDKIQYWLDLAQYDLDTAQAMLETKRYLYVGFMCHQVIEKTLKAIITKNDIETLPPKIHHLVRLAEKANIINNLSANDKMILFSLNPLNIEARYPSYKDSIYKSLENNNDCSKILDDTRGLFQCLKGML